MRYTFALIVEKALQLLDVSPLYLNAAPLSQVNGIEKLSCSFSHQDTAICIIDNVKENRELSEYPKGISNCIYLCSSEEAAHSPHLLQGIRRLKRRNCQNRSPKSILILPPEISIVQLEEALIKSFFYFNKWEEQLMELLRDHADWFAFIELAHEILQNPMLIYNSSMKILAYTRDDGSPDDLWINTVADGMARTDSADDAFELLKYVEKLDAIETPFRHQGKHMSDPFYSCNVMSGGRRIGMVTEMEHNHSVSQGQQDFLWNFSSLISVRMQQEVLQQQNIGDTFHQLLQDLLEGAIHSESQLNTRLIAVHWHRLEYIRVLWFAPAIPYISAEQWRKGLDAILDLPTHGLGSLYHDRIICLCSSETAELSEGLLQSFQFVCEKFAFRCGISEPFTNLLQTSRYSRQSEMALSLSSQELCFYQNVRFANLKQHFKSYEQPSDLLHPAVLLLEKTDRETGSEYVKTLQALFDSQYNQVQTAAALGIHRTTLTYRLHKIEDLTGIQMNNAEEMLHIQISLMLSEESHADGN